MREFGVKAENTDDQQKEKHVWRNDARKKFLPRGEFEVGACWIRQRERDLRAVEARDFAPIELAQQVVFGSCDDVDHFAVERFFFGEGFGVGDGGGGESWIAIALVGVAAEESERVVVDFLAHRFVDGHRIAADDHDRRSGACVRAGRHRGDVGGKQDVEAGAGGARAGWRDVDGDGHFGIEDVLDDVFHRRAQAAGSVHGDENERGVAAGSFVDSFVQVGGEDWFDFGVDFQVEDGLGGGLGFIGVRRWKERESGPRSERKRKR